MDPFAKIESYKEARKEHSPRALLAELATIAPLPNEGAHAWDSDATWERAYLLVAFGDLVARHKLANGVGLVLDRMCLGDPGEMMRGMRHSFEGAVDEDWKKLARICVSRCASPRAGTRYWAIDELVVLREPLALRALVRALDDRVREVAYASCMALELLARDHPETTPKVLAALEDVAKRRKAIAETANAAAAEVRKTSAPK